MMSTLALLPLAACAACGLLGLAAWRPAYACGALAFAIPITAGLARGAVIPVLRVNEALLAVVAAGFLIHLLIQRRPLPGRAQSWTFIGLDIIIFTFCAAPVLAGLRPLFTDRVNRSGAPPLVQPSHAGQRGGGRRGGR